MMPQQSNDTNSNRASNSHGTQFTDYRGRENEPGERVARDRITPADHISEEPVTNVAAPAHDAAVPPRPESPEDAGAPTLHTKRQFGAFDDPRGRIAESESGADDNLSNYESTAEKLGGSFRPETGPRDPS